MYFLTVFVLQAIIVVANSQNYKAGVLLFKEVKDPNIAPSEQLDENVKSVVKLINSYKNDKVDVLVFPEFALTNLIPESERLKTRLKKFSTVMGNVGDDACVTTGAKSQKYFGTLACAAKDNNMYAIVNLIEEEGDNFYLTNVGFDPKGSICLKCRQHHLPNNTGFDKALDQKSCGFTAKLQNENVTFSVLFGTDVLYPIPEDIKSENVIMTSSVMNNLPLNVGVSQYQGFAVSRGVNLIVGGFTDAEKNYGGSGIFYGNGTSKIAFGSEDVPNASANGAILISEVPSKSSPLSVINVQPSIVGKPPQIKNLQYMNIPAINATGKVVEQCLDKKCCHFNATLTADSILPYKWIVLSNKTTMMDQEMDIFLCALVVPNSNYPATPFQNVSISSNIEKSEILLTVPITLNQNFLPTNFIFNKQTRSIALNKEENVLVFGIIEILGTPVAPGSGTTNTTLIVVIVLLILVLVALIIAFLIWRKRQAKNRRNF